MRFARATRQLLMVGLLLAAPIPLAMGFALTAAASPFTTLSEGASTILNGSGLLAVGLYVGAWGAVLSRRLALSFKLLATTVPIPLVCFVIVLLTNPVFLDIERTGRIRERFEAAADAHPTQVWCNGGFAYLRPAGEDAGYDVLLHLPPEEGEFALRIAQYRVSEEHRSCDVSVFPESHAVARDWFEGCPDSRPAFERLVDRVRHPSTCPHSSIERWPKDTGSR